MVHLVCWLLLPVALTATGGTQEEWKAGIATVKITPQEPLQMSGYASRVKPFEKVNDDLYAKALALEDSAGHRGVIITTDVIGFHAALAEPICRRIGEKTGLKREQILLTSIHTHSAPTLSLDPTPSEGTAPEDARKTVEYTRWLQDRVVDIASEAVGKMTPARLSRGTGVAHFAMNRREFTENGVILGANPRGLSDRSVPVLRVEGPDGKLRGVLFSYACHNTTLTYRNMLLSGDYGGYAQSTIEERNPGAVALEMLGCAGDADPYPRGTMELAKEHGAALGAEVCRLLGEKLKPVRGPLKTLLENAAIPLMPAPPRAELETMAKSGPGP